MSSLTAPAKEPLVPAKSLPLTLMPGVPLPQMPVPRSAREVQEDSPSSLNTSGSVQSMHAKLLRAKCLREHSFDTEDNLLPDDSVMR